MRGTVWGAALVVLLAAACLVAADDADSGRAKKRKRMPKSPTQPIPAENSEPPEKPASEKPITTTSPPKEARPDFAWREGELRVPAEFAKRRFESAPPIVSPVGEPPLGRVGREMTDLLKTPAPPEVRVVTKIDLGGEAAALALSSDGALLVSGTTKGTVSVWNAATGEKVCRLESFTQKAIRDLCFSPDRQHVAVGAADPHARVFDARTGKLEYTHEFFHGGVHSLSISHDGEWLSGMDGEGRFGVFPLLGGEGVEMAQGIEKPSGLFLFAPRKATALVFGANNSPLIGMARLAPAQEKDGMSFGDMRPTIPRSRNGVCGAASDCTIVLAKAEAELLLVRFEGPEEGSPVLRSRMRGLRIRTGFCNRCALTPDDRYVIALSHSQGLLEVHPLEESNDVTMLELPVKEIKESAISYDGHSLALSAGKGAVTVCRLEAFPEGGHLRFSRAIRDHLARKEYRRLDAIAERLAKRAEALDWAPHEAAYDVFLASLLSGPDLIGHHDADGKLAQLAEWLAARPESVAARVAIGDLEMQIAWSIRGGGYVETVKEEQFKGFLEHAAKAAEALGGLPEEATRPPSWYHQRLTQLQANGWTDEEVERLEESVMKDFPEYLKFHELLAFSRLSRWYGETDADAEKYIRRVSDKLEGDRGDGLYGQLSVRLSRFFPKQEFIEKSGVDAERAQRGLQGLMERHPNDPLYRNMALRMAWTREDREGTAKLFEGFTPADWRAGAWTYSQYRAARDWSTGK